MAVTMLDLVVFLSSILYLWKQQSTLDQVIILLMILMLMSLCYKIGFIAVLIILEVHGEEHWFKEHKDFLNFLSWTLGNHSQAIISFIYFVMLARTFSFLKAFNRRRAISSIKILKKGSKYIVICSMVFITMQ